MKSGAHSPYDKKPRKLYSSGQTVYGARGCTQACIIRLESRGVLQNRFKDKFTRRKPWAMDGSQPAPSAEGPTAQQTQGYETD